MKKRVGAVLVAGVMACTMLGSLGLAGCGGKAKPDFEMPEGGFDTQTPVTIKFYHTMGDDLQSKLELYIQEFNKLFPNITIEHSQEGGYPDVLNKISNEIVAGNQPNVSYCYADHVALYNNAKAVLPLNDFLPGGAYADYDIAHADGSSEKLGITQEQKDMFTPGYWEEGYGFGDHSMMYTLPFAKSTEVLFYDQTFFEEHNISVPTTWEEMEQVCKTIKELDPNSTPLGYDSEANWFITMCEQKKSPYTSSEGENHFLFDNEVNRASVKMMKDWFDKGYLETQGTYGKYTSYLFKSTSATRSYMCIGSSAGAGKQIPDKVENGYRFKVGIAPIPQVDPSDPKVISQGPSVCIFKNEDPQKVLASWLFVKFLATSIDFQAEFSTESGYLPPLKMSELQKNETYAEIIAEAQKEPDEKAPKNDNTYLTSVASLVCMQQQNAYYTSDAFVGSSKAREQVEYLVKAVLAASGNVDEAIDKAFKSAIEECEYFSA